MKENLLKWKESLTGAWKERSKKQQTIYIGIAASILIFIIVILIYIFSTNEKFVPLYSNLSIQETSQIKEELDTRGIAYDLQDGGTTITVPEEQVDTLLVDLAGQGLPSSGNIDYSFFSENSSFGITDNEFNIMKLDAMQTELANLITSVDGIKSAEVMVNLPEESVFVGEEPEETSAAIVLETEAGYQFEESQIRALYHLVSNAVPNLPEENIGIMNQYFEYFDLDHGSQYSVENTHTYQQTVKKDIERDIQRRLQQMLGTMIGPDNVIVSVTADVDFTQENRIEELVEPVDIESMEGLPVSIETIQESYTGDQPEGGTVGTGEEDVTNYPGAVAGGDGEYDFDKETINYEFNRIQKEIVESPYKVRDLGIQVAVDNARATEEGNTDLLSQQEQNAVENGINSILESILTTSIDTETYGEIEPDDKVSVVFQEFTTSPTVETTEQTGIPTWVYFVAGILLLLIIILVVVLVRNNRSEEEQAVEEIPVQEYKEEVPDLPQEESEAVVLRKQLEKIAEEKPEDFAKLLRSWIGED